MMISSVRLCSIISFGGFGLYDMSGNQVELLRVNEQYCKITGTSAVELEERHKNVVNDVYQEDREELF